MVFLKKIEVREQRQKYGGTQRGLFALEPIKVGERVWYCECGEKDGTYTRQQLLDIIDKHPRLDYFVRSFSYMVDDDLYALPYTYMEERNNDECALFNHSCQPNVGMAEHGEADNMVAIRDIEPGDELTYHYGFLETEASLIYGLECKCNSIYCCGRLTFDYYRDELFVSKYYPFMTPYLKKKVNEMKEKWHSRSCYVKRFPSSDYAYPVVDLDELEIGLCSLKPIRKGELIAEFLGDEIAGSSHYLRHSVDANCHLIGRAVFASYDIPAETELTLCYHGILL